MKVKLIKETKHRKVTILGMELEEWAFKSCVAHIAEGDNWATVYDIQSKDESKGHATHLLLAAKDYYEKLGKTFGGSVALNSRMSKLYQRCGIKEYK